MTANFLFVSDDKYVKNLGICTYSVLHNMCPEVERVRLFVMDCGIAAENRERLRRQTARFENAEMVFCDLTVKLHEVVPKVPTKWHPAIYGRLFLTEILPLYEDVERLVYLDCDLLMDQPVTELFTRPLGGKCLAGVADADSAPRKAALGIHPQNTYINSGVLVIDTAKWMMLDASSRIVGYINSFPEAFLYPDQDAINYILCDEITLLPPVYNMMWMICHRDLPKMKQYIAEFPYTEEQLAEALYNGKIYHYAGHDMWSFYGITPVHAKVFRKYRRHSDWRGEKRHFGSVRNFVLWTLVWVKRIVIGEWYDIRRYKANRKKPAR